MNITRILTTVLVAGAILTGVSTVTVPTRTAYLADYGSNETAEIAGEHARDAGVRHNPDVQHHRR